MYILAIIDGILLAIIFTFTLFIPRPRNNYDIRVVASPLIDIQKQVVNDYIIKNGIDSLDTTKKYHIFYDTSLGELQLKEDCAKIYLNHFGLWLGNNQTIGQKYCIIIKQKNPLKVEIDFPGTTFKIKTQ